MWWLLLLGVAAVAMSGKKTGNGNKGKPDDGPGIECTAPDAPSVGGKPFYVLVQAEGPNKNQKLTAPIFDPKGTLCTVQDDKGWQTLVRKDGKTVYSSPRLPKTDPNSRGYTVYFATLWRIEYGTE